MNQCKSKRAHSNYHGSVCVKIDMNRWDQAREVIALLIDYPTPSFSTSKDAIDILKDIKKRNYQSPPRTITIDMGTVNPPVRRKTAIRLERTPLPVEGLEQYPPT